MTLPLLAAASSGRALWYLTRGTGIVALLALTAVVLLGVAGVTRWRTERLPRFVVQGLHRNLALLAVVFVALHVVTTVADGFAPIALTDAVIPFLSPYRPLWLGLGAVAFDLLLALTVTSLLRARLGLRTWRAVHWLAYVSWPVALLHSLGTGSDARVGWMTALATACTLSVAFAAVWRVATATSAAPGPRLAGLAAAVLVPLGLLVWYRGGPGAAGWAARAGTPASLLGRARTAQTVSLPAPPFAGRLRGTIVQSQPDAAGLVTVDIEARAGSEKVRVWMRGAPVSGGGVRVSTSRVSFGTTAAPNVYAGQLDSLDGSRLDAVLRDASGKALRLGLVLRVDRRHGVVAGSLHATALRGSSALGAEGSEGTE